MSERHTSLNEEKTFRQQLEDEIYHGKNSLVPNKGHVLQTLSKELKELNQTLFTNGLGPDELRRANFLNEIAETGIFEPQLSETQRLRLLKVIFTPDTP